MDLQSDANVNVSLFRCLIVNENLVGFLDQINGKESGILDVIIHLFLFQVGDLFVTPVVQTKMRGEFRFFDPKYAMIFLKILTYPHIGIADGFDLCSTQADKNVREIYGPK